jgi:hypothetical protein
VIQEKDMKKILEVRDQSGTLLRWWFEFTGNILKQGFISPRQRAKLYSLDLDREIARTYRSNKTRSVMASMDHDDMALDTGEPVAMEFYS